MKRSKRMLLELTNLPVVRKTLQTESNTVKFKDIKPGDVLMFPKKSKTKKYIVTSVLPFAGIVEFVEFRGELMSLKQDNAGEVTVSNGIGPFKPLEV